MPDLRILTYNVRKETNHAQALMGVKIVEKRADVLLLQEVEFDAQRDAVNWLTSVGWSVWWPAGEAHTGHPANKCVIAWRDSSGVTPRDAGQTRLVLVHLSAWAGRKVRPGEIGWPDRYFNTRLFNHDDRVLGLGVCHFPAGTWTRNRWLRPAWNLMYGRVLKATLTLKSHADWVVCGADMNTTSKLSPGGGKSPIKFIYGPAGTYNGKFYDALWTIRGAAPSKDRHIVKGTSDHFGLVARMHGW